MSEPVGLPNSSAGRKSRGNILSAAHKGKVYSFQFQTLRSLIYSMLPRILMNSSYHNSRGTDRVKM